MNHDQTTHLVYVNAPLGVQMKARKQLPYFNVRQVKVSALQNSDNLHSIYTSQEEAFMLSVSM